MPSYLKLDYQGRVVRIDTFSSASATRSPLSSSPLPSSAPTDLATSSFPFAQRRFAPALASAGRRATRSSPSASSAPTSRRRRRRPGSRRHSSAACSLSSGGSRATCAGSRVRPAVLLLVCASPTFSCGRASLRGDRRARRPCTDALFRPSAGIKAQYRDRRNTLVDALVDSAHASLDTRQAGAAFEYWTRDERDEKGLLVREKGSADAGRKILSFVSPEGGMFGASQCLSRPPSSTLSWPRA